MKKRVVVGISGGVDSSVAALLLKEQGYEVIGLFMKNWEEEEEGLCPAAQDFEDATLVCQQLEIPLYSVNFSKEYWERVFAHCLREFQAGYTPNPDILCNKEIKFSLFWEKARSLGADCMATGHYCRVGERDGEPVLLKGLDPAKDQSYFLYAMPKEALRRALFPVGELEKQEVRALAERHGLVTAKKRDSTGICFIGKRNFKEFMKQYLHFEKGAFETMEGKVVGEHDGVGYYTIGQRKGLAIGGPGEAWYVVGKDIARNVVLVDQGAEHPSLYSNSLKAEELSWLTKPKAFPLTCQAKIRYRQEEQDCVVEQKDATQVSVTFPEKQRAVTGRQSIVFYDGALCLGGGKIAARE